jgi:hypothetical protein
MVALESVIIMIIYLIPFAPLRTNSLNVTNGTFKIRSFNSQNSNLKDSTDAF